MAMAVRPNHREFKVSEAVSSRDVVSIRSNTQERLDDGVRIAAGNFWKETYTDASGAEVEGLTCALWISATDTSPVEHVRVHPGQKLKVGAQEAEVVEITEADVRLSVH